MFGLGLLSDLDCFIYLTRGTGGNISFLTCAVNDSIFGSESNSPEMEFLFFWEGFYA